MNGNPNVSGTRLPPQPYQQPNINEFRREVPDVSLVFNPDERSLVLPLLPSDRQHQQNLLHRSRSVPGRISDPARPPPQPAYYRTPPPRPTQESQGSGRVSPASSVPLRPSPASSVPQRPSSASSVPPRPSPLTRPASAAATATAYTDASSSHDDGGDGSRAGMSARRTPPVESPAAVSPRSQPAASPASSWGGGGGGVVGSTVPPDPSCCGAELRAVLRLVADNGRQLQQLRAQVRQLLNRPPAVAEAPAPPRNVLLREAQTQTERDSSPRRPAMTAAAVNTSFSLTPRRDIGTDPPPAPSPVPPLAPPADPGPARQFAPERPISAEVTGSGGRENTAQVQRRRVQEWVEGEGWAEEQEPELTLRGLELPTVPEQPPTPEASVHVDMPVYQPSPGGSCDGSVADDAETERPRRPDTTFFQNVMGQVNQILDGAARGESAGSADGSGGSQTLSASPVLRHSRDDDDVISAEPDPVRRATLQQLRAAGVSFAPTQADDESMLDYSCPPRAVRAAASVPCSTDLSLEMNTLAMKYVDSRQLMQRAAAARQFAPERPISAEVTGSGGRENTAQVQRRRVQEWVEGEGWAEEQEPELTLRGLELPTVPEQPPTPEASVHVDMPVYQPSPGGSCDGSVADDAETERPRRPDTTFFQNVMGQVNQILDGAARGESAGSADGSGGSQTLSASPVLRHSRDDDDVISAEPDPVRRATLQQLRAAGVSFAPTQADDESMLDYSCPPRAVRAAASVPCSTDLSLEMNTLAMKYVDSRQLMQRAAAVGGRPAPHPVESRLLGKENLAPPSRGRPTDMTMYGISDSNMSFSTRKYMEKFNLQW